MGKPQGGDKVTYIGPPGFEPDIPRWAQDLVQYLADNFQSLIALTGGQLQWQNLRSALISGTTPGTADTAFTATHNLGKTPEFYIWNVDEAAIIYADATDKGNWDEESIDLKCNAISVDYTLLVM